jgi:hypothetical protein
VAGVIIAYRTLEHIACEARPYPTYLLEDAETGLCLFSAAFYGHNAEIHFALEDVHTTCVDTDQEKLRVMETLYPEDWNFVCEDAWDFAEKAALREETWDIVSVDTFRGNATDRSLADLSVWTDIANTAVMATLEDTQVHMYEIPDGWKASHFRRNSEVLWLVLTRA